MKPLSSLDYNNSNVQPKPQVDSEGNFHGELRLFDDDVVSLLCMESGGTQMLNSDYSFSFEPDSQQELENVSPISGLEHNCNNLINECINTNNLISDGQLPLDQGYDFYVPASTTVIYLQNKLRQLKERNQALKKELERQRQKTSISELSSDDSWAINSQVGIVLAGSHNNLLTANDLFLNKLGYSREELYSLLKTYIYFLLLCMPVWP